MVPCKRSTKPLVQAWRGRVRVCRIPRAAQAWSQAPRYSLPQAVRTRRRGQPAAWGEDAPDGGVGLEIFQLRAYPKTVVHL